MDRPSRSPPEIRRTARKADLAGIARQIAQQVWDVHSVSVADVVILPTRRLPRTTSGKLQRQKCRAAYQDGKLPALARLHSSSGQAEVRSSSGQAEVRSAPTAASLEELAASTRGRACRVGGHRR